MKQLDAYPNLFIIDHPLIQHKLTLMRDEGRSTMGFRALLREIALLMGYEITDDLPLTTKRIRTPLEEMDAPVLAGKKVAIVSILRAGLGMVEGLHELIPSAREGHIGLYRDPETKMPVEYLVKLPKAEDRIFILVDPMLATGNSAVHAVDVLNRHGVPDERIRFMALVSAPEGVKVFHDAHPKVRVFTASLDRELNDHAYILPGLGDAGDRMFGTK
ncbi:MAG: uracil phosphoribosyltransferase [Pseudomonadota bacterium]